VAMNPVVLGPENDCAGKGQQQLETTDPSCRQRGFCIRSMTASVQLGERYYGYSADGEDVSRGYRQSRYRKTTVMTEDFMHTADAVIFRMCIPVNLL
jgi:hypothetical protein